MRRGLVLSGFMATGKSTVGRALSTRLDLPFIDTDTCLTQRYGEIAQQFAQYGELTFRRRERALISSLRGREPCVIATGGGAWLDYKNRRDLATIGPCIVLYAPLFALQHRLRNTKHRPLADTELASRYARRQRVYADADHHVSVHRREVTAIVDEILNLVDDARVSW